MKKAIFGLVAAAALASIVAIPSVASAKKYYRHYHHVYVANSSFPGLVRGQRLSYDECSRRAISLGLSFGQSGNGDYMRECTTGRPSGGTRQRNGGS